MQRASQRPFPSMRSTCAYSCPSSLKTSSLFSSSASFFPLLRFFPPFPLFFGILTKPTTRNSDCENYGFPHLTHNCPKQQQTPSRLHNLEPPTDSKFQQHTARRALASIPSSNLQNTIRNGS
ncbi:hypothetical protein Mapa_000649 [Marchantia paleacea]|nr:hypothetical protein Mapa_000649 [Marchantia paleacea]